MRHCQLMADTRRTVSPVMFDATAWAARCANLTAWRSGLRWLAQIVRYPGARTCGQRQEAPFWRYVLSPLCEWDLRRRHLRHRV